MCAKGLKRVRNKRRAARPRNGTSQVFFRDFAPLEASLGRGAKAGSTVMTPEQMIVELHLTPRLVRRLERRYRILFPWFAPTYTILVRHGLLPSARTDWEGWLKSYRKRRTEASQSQQRSAKRHSPRV